MEKDKQDVPMRRVRFAYSIQPLGSYVGGSLQVPADATDDEIKQAVLKECELKIGIY